VSLRSFENLIEKIENSWPKTIKSVLKSSKT
jgi:hypothetical protein